jgi:hypothetical protein
VFEGSGDVEKFNGFDDMGGFEEHLGLGIGRRIGQF